MSQGDAAGEPETMDDDDSIVWTASVDDFRFSTTIQTEEIEGVDVERIARKRLIEAVQNGEVDISWLKSYSTPEEREQDRKYREAMSCEHCGNYTEQEKREVTVGDEIVLACPSCVEDLKDKCNRCDRHRDELGEDESMDVVLDPNEPVEYACSSCI